MNMDAEKKTGEKGLIPNVHKSCFHLLWKKKAGKSRDRGKTIPLFPLSFPQKKSADGFCFLIPLRQAGEEEARSLPDRRIREQARVKRWPSMAA